MDEKAKAGLAVLVAVVLMVAAFFGGGYDKVTNAEAQALVDDAEELAAQDAVDAKALADQAKDEAVETAVTDAEAAKDLEIEGLQTQIDDYQETEAEEVEAEEELACGYELDDLMIDFIVSGKVFSDRELECALFDGEVEWDGDDYEAEETLELNGLYVGSNYEDFGADVCLELEEGEVLYRFEVEEDLDVDEDEMLEFSLLGEDVKLSEWTCNAITFFKGSKHRLNEGNELTVEFEGESYTLHVPIITEDSIWVDVSYGPIDDRVVDSDEIEEGESRVVGGLDIMVESVLENEAGELTPDMVILYVGNDVEVSVEHGDEYADDSPWEWDIGCEYIGLKLVEDFDEPDDDDFPALCAGQELCLPNNFLCIRFDGLVEEDYFDYDLDLDSGASRVQGDFELGIEDYDEVWCDSGMFYEDDDMETEDELGAVLGLKGSDIELECVSAGPYSRVCFNDPASWDGSNYLDLVCVRQNFGGANADWSDISGEDEDFISDFGIIIESPEDCLDDEDCRVSVPAERMEAIITIY